MTKTLSRFGQWLARHRQSAQTRDRRLRTAGMTWTGLEALENRALLSAGPTIAAVTANPTAVTRGSTITLTASGIVDTGAMLKSVVFYLDSNNDGVLDTGDRKLGAGKAVPNTDNFSLTVGTNNFKVSSDSVTGATVNNKVFAIATDADRNVGVQTSSAITVDSHAPSITKLQLVRTPDLSAGNALSLKAIGVKAHDTAVITSVAFYYDSTGDGILQIPSTTTGTTSTTDTLLGTDSAWPGGWTFTGNAPTTLPASGTVHLFAVVTDSDGSTSAPEELTATVEAPPTIGSLAATPTSAARGTATNVTLTASTVTDSDGKVKNVRFFFDSNGNGILDANDTLLPNPTVSGSNYTTTGKIPSTLTGGNATFFAVAQDDKGSTSVVSTVQVPITPPSIGSLTVDATVPTGATTPVVDRGGTLNLTASNLTPASNKTITSVQFFIDSNNNGMFDSADTSIGTETTTDANGNYTFPYSVPATATTGPTTFFAVATDSGGNTSPAASVAVTIGPSVGSFTVSNGNTTTGTPSAAINQTVIFTASNVIAATGKSISQVNFYLDVNNNGVFDSGTDTLAGAATLNATTGAWTLNYAIPSTTPTGTDTFLAVASDNSTPAVLSTAATVKLNVTPTIASVTSGAPTVGVNKTLVLNAINVQTSTGKTISKVQFFLDSNGNGTFDSGIDAFEGNGTLQSNGTWQLTLNNLPTSIPVGSNTFFAVATDSSNIASPAASVMVNVAPSVGLVTTSIMAGQTAAPGQTITITASGVMTSTGQTVSSVAFYLDVNNNATFDPGIDTPLGTPNTGVLQPDGTYTFSYTIPDDTPTGQLTFLAVATDGTITGLAGNVVVNVVAPTGT